MKRLAIISATVVVVLSAVYVAVAFYLGTPYIFASTQVSIIEQSDFTDAKKSNLDDALKLLAKAKAWADEVKDYECLYLREELIQGKLDGKDKEIKNLVHLKVRHQPFSVYMKWLEPDSKKGREVGWTSPDKEMCVKGVPLVKSAPIDGIIATSESRRPINQAGLKNMIERLNISWEKEKKMGKTAVEFQDVQIKLKLTDSEHTLDCHCVTTIHDPQHRETPDGHKFQFYRTRCYFEKQTGMLVRMEGYDWPKNDDDEGRLLERHTFLNMKTNVGHDDKTFKW